MPRRVIGPPGGEMGRLIKPASLNLAFELAHSIYRFDEACRPIALRIVIEALQALDVRLSAQVEADRHDPRKPTKVRWNTTQWFQILILCKSVKYEMEQESKRKILVSREDMIIRYLKHLAVTTYRRNSFHVSLGVTRLVYGYSAAEAIAVYDMVFQDPDLSTRKADAYYRARKSKLIEELESRFHGFLKIEEGLRNEKRFHLDPESNKFSALVADYLRRFTPWETACELPRKVDAWSTINSLQSSQANQIHTLVHPSCFARIAEALKLTPPELSLALPKFILESSTPPDHPTGSKLTDREINNVQRTLKDDREKRKRLEPESLRVLIDGVELAHLTLSQAEVIRFNPPTHSTLIEVFGCERDYELLLASHVIIDEDVDSASTSPERYTIELEGGQRISLTVTHDESDELIVEIRYAQKKLVSWWHQLTQGLFAAERIRPRRLSAVRVAALALILLAVIGAIAILFTVSPRSGDHITQVGPTPAPGASLLVVQPTPSPQRTTAVASPSPSAKPSPTTERTRDQTTTSIKSLSETHNIYVPAFGSDSFSRLLRNKVIEKLRERFNIVAEPDDADTAVAASISLVHSTDKTAQDEVGFLQLRLLNAAGEVIWRTKRYRGTASDIAERLAGDLKVAIEGQNHR